MLTDLSGAPLSALKAQLLDIDRAEYEDSLRLFMQAAWPYIDPAKWKDGWVIDAICEHLQAVVDGEIKRLIINLPPRTLKTSLCSIAFPAWTWAQRFASPTSGPQVKFMYASYGEGLSLDHSTACRHLIKSEWYQQYWGDRYRLRADQDTKHKFTNDKMGERQITSIGARVTGRGGQIILIDDPNAANESQSEAKIKSVTEWWDQTMNSRLNDRETGAFIIIQQRLAEGDLTGHILEKQADGWDHLMLPMRYESDRTTRTSIGWKDPRTEEGELLWPDRFSEASVKALEREHGPWGFAGQYQQRPEPKGGGIIKRDWWQLWEPEKYPPMDYIIASLDTAYTVKTENDFSAMSIWGVFSGDTTAQATRILDQDGRPVYEGRTYQEGAPKVMLMYAWQKRMELHELVEKVAADCKKFKIDQLLVEAKAAGHSVAQEIRRLYGHEGFSVLLYDPKSQDKLSRLYSIQHLFAEKMIYTPDMVWAEEVITQVGQFPRGRHDDLVDTVSQALRHLRQIGLLVRAPERLHEIADAMRHDGKAPEPLYPA